MPRSRARTRSKRAKRGLIVRPGTNPPAQRRPLREWLTKPAVWLWAAIGAVATLTSLSFFWPSVSVEMTELLDPSNALSAPIEVTNDGNLSLHSVTIACAIQSIEFGVNNSFKYGAFTARRAVDVIDKGESVTTTCDLLRSGAPRRANPQLRSADIAVVVSFRPSFWPALTEITRRFSTVADSSGKLRWIRKAVAEK